MSAATQENDPPRSSNARSATVHLLSGQVTYRALLAIFWVALARLTAPEQVGEFAVANSISVVAFVCLDAGLSRYLVREFLPGSGFPLYLRKIIRWRSTLVVIGCAIAGIGTTLLVPSTTASLTGLLVGSGYALDFLCQAWLAPDRAMLEMHPDRLMKLVQGAGSLIAIVVINAWWTVGAASVSAGVLCAYILAAAHPLYRWRLQHQWADEDIDTRPSGAVWRSAAAFATTGILTALYTRIDDIFVQVTRGVTVVASYALAYKLIESARLPSWAITQVVLATESDKIARSARRGRSGFPIRVSILISGVAALACSGAGPFLVDVLFDRGYEATGAVVRILAVSILISGLTGPAEGLLLAVGAEEDAARVSIVTALVTIAGLCVLTPRFGAQGAAWAVVAAHTVTGITLFRLIRCHSADLFGRKFMALFVTAVAALVCAAAAPRLTPVAVLIGAAAMSAMVLNLRSERP